MSRLTYLVAGMALISAPRLGAQVAVATKIEPGRDYFDSITQLESAPYAALPAALADSARSIRYRLAVLTSEIYNTLMIEQVRFGDAGCCARVAIVREVNLEQMARDFGLSGELAGVRIVRPLSPTGFRITVHGRTFDLEDIDRPTLRVTEVK